MIVRPKGENEEVSSESVLQDIQALRTKNAAPNEASENSDTAAPNEDVVLWRL